MVDMFATDRPETRSHVADCGQRGRRVTRRPSPQVLRLVVPLLLLAVFAYEFSASRRNAPAHTTTSIDLSQLLARVEARPGSVSRVVFDPGSLQVSATLTGGNVLQANYPSDQSALGLQTLLERQKVDFAAKAPSHGSALTSILVSLLPILLIAAIWIFVMRRMRGGAGGIGQMMSFGKHKAQPARPGSAEGRLQGRRRRRRGGRGAAGDQGVPRRPAALPGARRPHPQGRAALRPARHRQDAARARGRGRGRRPVLLDLRLRLRRDVRRRRRQPRARPVQGGEGGGALHRLRRRARRRRPPSRRRHRRRQRRARADAEPAARRDGRLLGQPEHHPDRRRPTGPTFSIRRCCAPAASTGRSSSTAPTASAAARSSRSTSRASRWLRRSTSTAWRRRRRA